MWRILITCNIDLKHDYITIQVKINNFTVDCLKSYVVVKHSSDKGLSHRSLFVCVFTSLTF
jgi:hypothetical protein